MKEQGSEICMHLIYPCQGSKVRDSWLTNMQTKDQADVLMMPKDHMRFKALFKTKELKIFKMDDQDSLQSLRKGIFNRKGIPIEVAKGLAKKFKLKSLFQEIYSLVIDYQRM